MVSTDGPLGDEVFLDCGRVCLPNVGVMDPGRDAVYFESGGGCQHYDAGSFPAQFKGLSVVPLDINPVSWPVPMRCQSRASLVDGVEVCPNVLMHFLELSSFGPSASCQRWRPRSLEESAVVASGILAGSRVCLLLAAAMARDCLSLGGSRLLYTFLATTSKSCRLFSPSLFSVIFF